MALELRKLTKRVGAETHIHATDLVLAEQGFNILLGTTLSGKTTLMKLMAGIDRPDISILSDEFLEDVRKMPQRNLAAELLERLIEDKIRLRGKTHIQQEKKYSELLDNALTKYRNRSIETAQVIEELIEIARQMREDGPPEGMTDEEFAFYGALLWNEEEIREGMADEALRELYRSPATFGICRQCERRIAFERLDTIPHARLCITCKQGAESRASARADTSTDAGAETSAELQAFLRRGTFGGTAVHLVVGLTLDVSILARQGLLLP